MRGIILASILVAASRLAVATPHSLPLAYRVDVCMDNEPAWNLGTAREMAAAIFVPAGVKLLWHGQAHCPSGALRVSLASQTPEKLRPDALAYGLPYEGTHIAVFMDRVSAFSPALTPRVLAHVLAHEITHILQGCAHHSQSGLMKSRWCEGDFKAMAYSYLPFTAEDLELIRRQRPCREPGPSSQCHNDQTAEGSR
jgi:Zn-dependent protease with chaperone function